MQLREIFKAEETELSMKVGHGVSVFLTDEATRGTLPVALFWSILVHAVLLLLAYLVAHFLTFILMYFGINIDLFSRPNLKMRDIEFVFVLPEKYNVKQSFANIKQSGQNYTLAGPEPNNRPYNGDEGSLKSNSKDLNKAKDKVVNTKPLKNTKQVASQTTVPFSKKTKKGSYIPKVSEPGAFSANIQNLEAKGEIGWGTQGNQGYHSPSAGNATIKGGGAGSGGSGTGDSVGKGTTKGGGYYYGAAGAPRPQTANNYKNEGLDINLNPYATELQRKVVRNWSIPSNDASKKTVLFLRISKSGNLMILNVKTPSGDTRIDELAINAVKKAQPFSPLPQGYRNAYADFVLTVGYNVSARAN